jgi:cephalosporin hydroxylase
VDGRAGAEESVRPVRAAGHPHRLKPALIIETGTAFGGSALFMAHVCDLARRGHVISIDLEPHATLPQHPRITYRVGSSVDPEIVAYVRERARRAAAGRSS